MKGQDQYIENFNRMINKTINNAKGEIEEVLRGFLNHIRDSFSISTKYSYLKIIDRFMKYINKEVKNINYEDYSAFLGKITDKSSTYKIMTHAALKLFSEYLMASRRNVNNAMQYIKVPKTSKSKEKIKKEKRLNNVLHSDEIKIYIRNVECGCGSSLEIARREQWKERDRCIIEIFLSTGMRCSALYRINLSDIDFNEKTITVLEKRDKLRTFYFSDNTRMCIEEWLLKRKELLGDIEEDALFVSNRKKRLDTKAIANITKKYGIGIKNTSPHKLRATFGTQLLEKTNGDLNLVRIAMGHESISTTEIYMRRDEAVVGKKVAEMMDSII